MLCSSYSPLLSYLHLGYGTSNNGLSGYNASFVIIVTISFLALAPACFLKFWGSKLKQGRCKGTCTWIIAVSGKTGTGDRHNVKNRISWSNKIRLSHMTSWRIATCLKIYFNELDTRHRWVPRIQCCSH